MLVAVGADTLLKKTVGADITDPFVQKGIKALQVLEDLKNDELAYQAGGMRYWPLTNGFVTVSGLVVAPTGDVLTFTPTPIVVLEYQDAHEAAVRQMAEATPLFEQATVRSLPLQPMARHPCHKKSRLRKSCWISAPSRCQT